MNKMAALAGAAALALIPATAGAQVQEATAAAATKVDPRAVVADVKRIINENYVLPEMRPQLAAALDKGLAAGRYDVSETGVLAERTGAEQRRGPRTAEEPELPVRGRRRQDRDVAGPHPPQQVLRLHEEPVRRRRLVEDDRVRVAEQAAPEQVEEVVVPRQGDVRRAERPVPYRRPDGAVPDGDRRLARRAGAGAAI